MTAVFRCGTTGKTLSTSASRWRTPTPSATRSRAWPSPTTTGCWRPGATTGASSCGMWGEREHLGRGRWLANYLDIQNIQCDAVPILWLASHSLPIDDKDEFTSFTSICSSQKKPLTVIIKCILRLLRLTLRQFNWRKFNFNQFYSVHTDGRVSVNRFD